MALDLVIRGGLVATATDAFVADLGVDTGRIASIGLELPPGTREIDARGLQVLPGGVDVHTHLDLDLGGTRTADDFESGTAAAACGGVTTICDYAWQAKGQSLAATIAAWAAKARGRAHVDYGFHIILSDVTDARIAEIPAIVGAGYPSFKVFTIREFGIGDEALLRVLRAARERGRDRQRPLREQRDARLGREGHDRRRAPRPEVLRREPPRAGRGRGHAAGHRLRGAGRRGGLHRPHVVRGGGGGGACGPPARCASVGRDAPHLPRAHERAIPPGRPRGGEGDRGPAPARASRSGRPLGRAPRGDAPDHRQRQHLLDGGPEGGGRAGLPPGPLRGPRARDGDAGHLLRGGLARAHPSSDVRGRFRHEPGQDLRPLSAEGHHRRRERRRPRPLRPEEGRDHRRAAAALSRRLRPLPRVHGDRGARADDLARRGRSRRMGSC